MVHRLLLFSGLKEGADDYLVKPFAAVLALLDNAIKYTPRGGHVTVRTAVNDEYALLEVVDTGIGIAPEHLPNLGKRFYRADKGYGKDSFPEQPYEPLIKAASP